MTRASAWRGQNEIRRCRSGRLVKRLLHPQRMPQGTKFPRRGTFTVIGGKGRYEGAKGDGTWEGDGTRSGPAAISYIDNVVNIKK
jgi:hypothetical protein